MACVCEQADLEIADREKDLIMRLMHACAIFSVITASVTPAISAAETATGGSLAKVSGNVVVSRDGELLRAVPNMPLRIGDRVITQTGGKAQLSMNGCATSVGSNQMASISGASCQAQVASFDRAGYDGSSSALADDDSDSRLGAGTYVIGGLALAAAGAGIYFATKSYHGNNAPFNGGGGTTPASP